MGVNIPITTVPNTGCRISEKPAEYNPKPPFKPIDNNKYIEIVSKTCGGTLKSDFMNAAKAPSINAKTAGEVKFAIIKSAFI